MTQDRVTSAAIDLVHRLVEENPGADQAECAILNFSRPEPGFWRVSAVWVPDDSLSRNDAEWQAKHR